MTREWYIRVRGKVTGPFSTDDLHAFARKGQLQPHHEVSRDQVTWQAARLVLGETAEPPPRLPGPAPARPRDSYPAGGLSPLVAAVLGLVAALLGAGVTWGIASLVLSSLRRQLGDEQAQMATLEQQLAALQQDRDKLDFLGAQAQKDLSALQEQLAARDARLDKLSAELADAREAARKDAGEQQRAARQRDALVADRDRLAGECDAARKEADAFRADNNRLLVLLGTDGLATEAEVQAELERLRGEVDRAARDVSRWKDLLDNLTPEKKRQYFPTNPEDNEAVRMRKEVRDLDAALPRLERRLETLRRVPAGASRSRDAEELLNRVRAAAKAWDQVRGEIRKYVRGLS